MNKICTDINQSEKLIKLGIDVNTADMCHRYRWSNNSFLILPCAENAREPITGDIPAWSLSKLLGLMTTDDKKDEYYVDTESHSDYHIVSYRNCWDGCIHSENSEESLLDAAFKMVVWLKENEKL